MKPAANLIPRSMSLFSRVHGSTLYGQHESQRTHTAVQEADRACHEEFVRVMLSDVCISRGCSMCLAAATNRQLKLGTAESRFVSRKKRRCFQASSGGKLSKKPLKTLGDRNENLREWDCRLMNQALIEEINRNKTRG